MSKELSRLEEIKLRDIWPNEVADFTPWLAKEENLSLLGERLNMELELEGQELDVGDFRADILCRNIEDDSRVLIENQLEGTNHNHLGQILTYAAGLDTNTVIWIARQFREEHRAALDHLNEITDERFQYFGIEVKVWQIGDSAPAPQFEIVSSPNNWRREVSYDRGRAVSKDLSQTQRQTKRQQEKFWTELQNTELQNHTTQTGSQLRFPKPQPAHHLDFNIGHSDFRIRLSQNRQNKYIGASIYLIGQNAEAHFHLLNEQRENLESEFGVPLEWSEKERWVYLLKQDTDPTDETDWPNQHEWLASKLELFDKVFSPRIKVLNAADWEPPED